MSALVSEESLLLCGECNCILEQKGTCRSNACWPHLFFWLICFHFKAHSHSFLISSTKCLALSPARFTSLSDGCQWQNKFLTDLYLFLHSQAASNGFFFLSGDPYCVTSNESRPNLKAQFHFCLWIVVVFPIVVSTLSVWRSRHEQDLRD